MRTLLGARDLGLKTEWRSAFVPFEFLAEPTGDPAPVDEREERLEKSAKKVCEALGFHTSGYE
jgi:hypothetical protein